MIPKIIHYCWFGKGEKSSLINKCIDSWRRHCPDYEIIEWNEENFDINTNRFAKEAYESKKYAFVSDYVRLHVLNEYGGVYVDTDLEIRKNIDVFLKHRAFSSFESKNYIPTAIMGAEKGHPWIKDLLNYYYDKNFILKNGEMDMTPNPEVITKITIEKYGLTLNNQEQVLKDGIHIYPDYVFCKDKWHGENFSVHHFIGSWLGDRNSCEDRLKRYEKNYNALVNILDALEYKSKSSFSFDNYKNIYLFGAGKITKQLLKYFNLMDYQLDGIITRDNKDMIFGVKAIPLNKLEQLDSEDLIIVIPSYDFESICEEILNRTYCEIISIEMIFD